LPPLLSSLQTAVSFLFCRTIPKEVPQQRYTKQKKTKNEPPNKIQNEIKINPIKSIKKKLRERIGMEKNMKI